MDRTQWCKAQNQRPLQQNSHDLRIHLVFNSDWSLASTLHRTIALFAWSPETSTSLNFRECQPSNTARISAQVFPLGSVRNGMGNDRRILQSSALSARGDRSEFSCGDTHVV